MTRLLATLKSRSAFAYDNTANHKAQGRIYGDLERAGFGHLHDKEGPKLFGFTLPFPNYGGEKGVTRNFMFAAHNPAIVNGVKTSLENNPEFNIGEMPFHITNVNQINPTVGENGVIETSTPIVLRTDQERAEEEFGVSTDYDRAYWKEQHGTNLFFHRLHENLQRKYRLAYGEKPPEPPYFTNFQFRGTYSKPVAFPNGDELFVFSEWAFEYTVQSAAHRKLLNLVLDVGMGELCSLGFGFMNVDQGARLNEASQQE